MRALTYKRIGQVYISQKDPFPGKEWFCEEAGSKESQSQSQTGGRIGDHKGFLILHI